jgi:uncharacterized membrane protein YeaQ/YmgE (transglycosylase-associated protein family)
MFCGYQSILFSLFTTTFAIREGFLPEDPRLTKLFKYLTLERGLVVSVVAGMIGAVLLGIAVNDWRTQGFGPLDYRHTMRLVIPGASLFAVGFQTFLSSFFVSILGMKRK